MFASLVHTDVTVGWIASLVDTRTPFKFLSQRNNNNRHGHNQALNLEPINYQAGALDSHAIPQTQTDTQTHRVVLN